jgi:hypothetical protein
MFRSSPFRAYFPVNSVFREYFSGKRGLQGNWMFLLGRANRLKRA